MIKVGLVALASVAVTRNAVAAAADKAKEEIIGEVEAERKRWLRWAEFSGEKYPTRDETAKVDFRLRGRQEHMKELREGGKIDMLIIGGGAMGSGVAIEAASRGIKCAVIDANDFSAGSSSRSTKLAQGGMGTFEKMLKLEGNPFDHFNTIKVFMNERNYFLEAAPFMNHQYEIVIPERSLLKTLFVFYPGIALFHGFYLAFLAWTNFLTSIDGPSLLTR